MFTGITQALCKITTINKTNNFLSYQVALPENLTNNLQLGASIAVDGVCQTIVEIHNNLVTFEAIKETLDKTTLNDLDINSLVNIERAAKIGDEIGGHLTSGHVIGTGVILKKFSQNNLNLNINPDINSDINQNIILEISCDPDYIKYILPKGFIAIDGISLTVVNVDHINNKFTVHLIPETLKRTTLGFKNINNLVNIEIDSQTQAIVNTVENWLNINKNKFL